jgi:cyclopropane-fatty-acyl-phospholipid synthase
MWDHVLDHMLGRLVKAGTLRVEMPDGKVLRHGDGTLPDVKVSLKDASLPGKLVRNPDLAVGEAYMDGSLVIAGDDLHGLLTLAIRNTTETGKVWWQRLFDQAQVALKVLSQFNPTPRARRNVAHHYDLSGELYDLFLDADRQYSCGYFKQPTDTLEQAQAQKKAHIAAKLRIEPGMKVLDIGCGWGGLGLTLARDYGAQVLGVTLSEEQHKIARHRAEMAGLGGQVEFRLTDYRHVTGQFDRVVSVGMFEHVGVPHYREFFRHVSDRLAPGGVALIHTIGRAAPPSFTSPWITRYIFPGGYVPALSEMMTAVEHEGLWTTDVEVWRMHYAETLRHWHDRFMANIDRARTIYDDRFCRMWRYYLVASELTFRHGRQCVFQVQLAHDQQAVPLTRDYIAASPSRTKMVEAAQ